MRGGDNLKQIFDKCSLKIPAFETYLTSGNEVFSIDGGPKVEVTVDIFNRKRSGKVNTMENNTARIVKIGERSGAHSIILVKYDNYEWSLFDPNGKYDFKENIFNLYDRGNNNVTDQYLSVTPERSLNQGYSQGKVIPEKINPGLCGVFGIIFICFFLDNVDRNVNWIDDWLSFCNYLQNKSPNGEYKYSLDFGGQVLRTIHNFQGSDYESLKNIIQKMISEEIISKNMSSEENKKRSLDEDLQGEPIDKKIKMSEMNGGRKKTRKRKKSTSKPKKNRTRSTIRKKKSLVKKKLNKRRMR